MNNVINYTGSISLPSYVKKNIQKAGETTVKVAEYFRDKMWNFIKQPIKMTQKGFKIAAVKIPNFDPKVLRVISGLGVIAILNALLTASKIPAICKNVAYNIKIGDVEGAIVGGINLVVAPLDVLDSTISFTSALVSLGAISTVTVFSVIALPLGLGLLSFASIKGFYDIVHLTYQMYQSPGKISDKGFADLLKKLDNKLEVTDREKAKLNNKYSSDQTRLDKEVKVLKARKINILTRRTDKKIVKIMQDLRTHLKSDQDNDLNKTNEALADIRTLSRRKIGIVTSGTLANLALAVTLACTLVFPIAAITVPIVGMIRHAVKLGVHAYKQTAFDKGLNNPFETKTEN